MNTENVQVESEEDIKKKAKQAARKINNDKYYAKHRERILEKQKIDRLTEEQQIRLKAYYEKVKVEQIKKRILRYNNNKNGLKKMMDLLTLNNIDYSELDIK